MNRLNWLDVVKGIGIIFVVIGHVGRGLVNSGLITDEHLYYYWDNIIYSFHMPLFFLVSGYLAFSQLQKHSLKKFVFSKVDVILYPYIIWSWIQGSIELVMSGYTNRTELDMSFINVFETHAQFWFLYWLFIFSMFIAISVLFPKYNKVYFLLLITVSFLCYFYQLGTPYLYNNLVYFLFGYFLSSVKFIPKISYKMLAGSILLSVGLQYYASGKYDYSYEMSNYDLGSVAITSSTLLAVIYLSVQICGGRFPFVEKILAYLGNVSLPIYLMHILLASGARIILQRFMHIDSVYMHWIIGIGFGLGVSVVIDLVLKRLGIWWLYRSKLSSSSALLKSR